MTRRLVTMTIDDTDLPLVRHIESATILNKPAVDGYSFEERSYPYGQEEARALMDPEGYATAIIEVPVETFTQGIAEATAENDVYDVLHEIAFGDFGLTEDSDYEVLGVIDRAPSLVIKYTTRLSPFFEGEDTKYPLYRA